MTRFHNIFHVIFWDTSSENKHLLIFAFGSYELCYIVTLVAAVVVPCGGYLCGGREEEQSGAAVAMTNMLTWWVDGGRGDKIRIP